MARGPLATLFQLYGSPRPLWAATMKAFAYARSRGISGLVRAVRRKIAHPTLPIGAPELEEGERLAFEERWVIRGSGLTRRHLTSIIILTKGAQALLDACLASLARSILPDAKVEILIVNNGRPVGLPPSFPFPIRVLRETRRFNWAAYNNRAAEYATGEFLLFLNDDVEALHGGWLDAMLAEALRPGVGAVGAKLLYPNGRIQHYGIVMEGSQPRHLGKFFPRDDPGLTGDPPESRIVDAVTGACLLTPRRVLLQHHFDERFAYNYNDVDYCLRLWKARQQTLVTPFAELIHRETTTRPIRVPPREVRLLQEKMDPDISRVRTVRLSMLSSTYALLNIHPIGSQYVREQKPLNSFPFV